MEHLIKSIYGSSQILIPNKPTLEFKLFTFGNIGAAKDDTKSDHGFVGSINNNISINQMVNKTVHVKSQYLIQ